MRQRQWSGKTWSATNHRPGVCVSVCVSVCVCVCVCVSACVCVLERPMASLPYVSMLSVQADFVVDLVCVCVCVCVCECVSV